MGGVGRGRTRRRRLALVAALALTSMVAVALWALLRSPPTPPTSRPPRHVPTWAYDDGCNGGSGASASLVRTWVSYAESNCGPRARKALHDCRSGRATPCIAVQYLDPNWVFMRGSVPIMRAAQESWWLHYPGSGPTTPRIWVRSHGGGGVLDQLRGAVDGWFRRYVRRHYNAYPALMIDDSSPSLRGELYYAGVRTSREIHSDRALRAAHARMAAALTHRDGHPYLQIDNALSPNPSLPAPFAMLGRPPAVRGLIAEGAPLDDGRLTPYYATLLDEIARIDSRSRDFVVLLSYARGGSPRARRLQAATVWLGYDGEHVVSWSDLERGSDRLAVWPEEGIVPTHPLQSMSPPGGSGCLAGVGVICSQGGHHDLEVALGVYRREFADCYDQGIPFGPCAAIVNTTGSPVTIQRSWLSRPYGHEITFDGGDVQSGGRLKLRGAGFRAGASRVPAGDALLLSGR